MRALDGLSQLKDFANPRVARRLREAGTVSPRSPLGVMASLPWLLGRGPSLGIISQMNAVVLGGKPAVIDRKGSFSFKQIDAGSNRFANALATRGIKGDARVALLLRNGREFAESLLAAQKASVTCCPLNTWAKTKELKATVANAGPSLIVY